MVLSVLTTTTATSRRRMRGTASSTTTSPPSSIVVLAITVAVAVTAACTLQILGSVAVVVTAVEAFSANDPQSSRSAAKILVSGASGKLGRIVVSKLEQDPRYEPKALVRSEESAKQLLATSGGGGGGGRSSSTVSTGIPLEHILIGDVTSPTFVDNTFDALRQYVSNIDAMIICTSSVPQIRRRSLVAMLLKAPWNMLRRKPIMDIRSMTFKWKYGGYPELVDYRGQIAQFQLAKRLGIKHVVLVSSMGGTDPSNFLNSVGKQKKRNRNKKDTNGNNEDDNDDDSHGDILIWKRRAEQYLATESGIESYTIIHPGGLIDDPKGSGGRSDRVGVHDDDDDDDEKEFVLDVDDNIYNRRHNHHNHHHDDERGVDVNERHERTCISRTDVADLCIAALSVGRHRKISFDCITRPRQGKRSSPMITAAAATAAAGAHYHSEANTSYTPTATTVRRRRKSAEEALQQFVELSKTSSDYAVR